MTVLEQIAEALRIAADHDRGFAFFPDDLAVSVRNLVQRNEQLGELVDEYKALAMLQAGIR